jgi:centrosomal protein CEP104
LYKAAIEVAQNACEDKLLQIYFIGLRVLSTAMTPKICETNVGAGLINTSIKRFVPMLITKIGELNYRARDISLHTLVSLFHHPDVDIRILIDNIMEIVEKEGSPTPDKLPWRICLARLEILLSTVKEFGINHDVWNWKIIFNKLIHPSLLHQNQDVRYMCIELIVQFFKLLGDDVKLEVMEFKDLKPKLMQSILQKLDQVLEQDPDLRNKHLEKKGGLPIIEEEKATPPQSTNRVNKFN